MKKIALKVFPFEDKHQNIDSILLVNDQKQWKTDKKIPTDTNWARWLPHILKNEYTIIRNERDDEKVMFNSATITPEDLRFWQRCVFEISLDRRLRPTVKAELVEAPEDQNLYSLPNINNPIEPLDFLGKDKDYFKNSIKISCLCGNKVGWEDEKCGICSRKIILRSSHRKTLIRMAEKSSDRIVNDLFQNVGNNLLFSLSEYRSIAKKRFKKREKENIFDEKRRKKSFLNNQIKRLNPANFWKKIRKVIDVGDKCKNLITREMKSHFQCVSTEIPAEFFELPPALKEKFNLVLLKNYNFIFQFSKGHADEFKSLATSYLKIVPLLNLKKPKGFKDYSKIIGKKVWGKVWPGAKKKRKKAKKVTEKNLSIFSQKYNKYLSRASKEASRLQREAKISNKNLQRTLKNSFVNFFIAQWVYLFENQTEERQKKKLANIITKKSWKSRIPQIIKIVIWMLIVVGILAIGYMHITYNQF